MFKVIDVLKNKKWEGLMTRLLLIWFCISLSLNMATAHEIIHKKITIYHPYLMIDKENKAHAFMSIENLGDQREFLIGIKPKFSNSYELFKIDDEGIASNINLREGLEIPPGEAVYFESETIGLTFSDLKEGISWFNPHIATFVFKNAGTIELDFEVEP
tara:strand:+ start:298 stop:774 length:477 start_codon:yes stop_codon:yes gene_type:complete